jgi:putative transcriptional regulator
MDTFDLKKPPFKDPASGKLLIAEPFLKDGNFSRTVIFLCEHSTDGSIGFVLNQDTDLQLGDILVELSSSQEPIYQGGPVQNDTLHMLHQVPQLLEGKEVGKDIYWGGSFDALQETILMHAHQPRTIKLFLGYAGWAAGQLDAEMQEGSWIVADATPDIVFNTPPNQVWKKAIELLGDEYRYLSQMPIDPQLN